MKFLEYKAKEIFARYGIPVPRGIVASNAVDISDPPLPCMVKAQVLVGGRGKAGGIKAAESLDEARAVSRQILGMDIHGYRVKQVYLEERLDISKELYVGLTIDRSAREPLLMASATGGMEIEAVPRDQIFMEHVPAMAGLQPYVMRTMLSFLGLPKDTGDRVADIVRRSYSLFRKEDAELVEINPLAVTRDGRVIAGDAKLKGGRGGTFLDLGGTDDSEKVKQAFEILIKANPSAILLNIFGGITKADTVALGVQQALED